MKELLGGLLAFVLLSIVVPGISHADMLYVRSADRFAPDPPLDTVAGIILRFVAQVCVLVSVGGSLIALRWIRKKSLEIKSPEDAGGKTPRPDLTKMSPPNL